VKRQTDGHALYVPFGKSVESTALDANAELYLILPKVTAGGALKVDDFAGMGRWMYGQAREYCWCMYSKIITAA
jgi:hypothetical protein